MSKRRSGKSKAGRPANGPVLITPDAQADLQARLWTLMAQFRASRNADKVLVAALRLGMDFFGAADGCVVAVEPASPVCRLLTALPGAGDWDTDLLTGFLRGHNMPIQPDVMYARIRRNDRKWGALALRCPGRELQWDARHAFSEIGAVATELVARVDEARIREVRARLDRKILEQISPKDLFYQILHGLRSLVSYDHSAALLICDEARQTVEIVAEQIAWRKAKSDNVGLRLPLDPALLERLASGDVLRLDRAADGWRDETGQDAQPMAELLDYNPPEAAENSLLCGLLAKRQGVMGLLKLAAVHPGSFGPFEATVTSQFLAHAALAVENLRRTQLLTERMETAERELDQARNFQMSMLPPPECRWPGISLSARYLPCTQLAGDFYDYARVDDDRVALIVADVVGHGASAAMMTGLIKAAFHAAREDRFDPLAVIERLKYNVRAFDSSWFLTLLCARIDVTRQELTFVNAGHPPGIVRRSGVPTAVLRSTGPMVSSALFDVPFEAETISLHEADLVLLYTDGMTEAWGASGMFGLERVLAALGENGAAGSELLNRLLLGVEEFGAGQPIDDDITVLAAEL